MAARPPSAFAATSPVGLGTATTYAVLAGSTVTNTGPTAVTGDLGVSPGTAITGFPPGVVNGTIHAGDTAAQLAQNDLTIGYNDAAGRAPTANIAGDLGGLTLTDGVYAASSSIGITGALTLDGLGDPASVFIFQIGSTLTTASGSTIQLINGAQACNVFWQVGSSATLGTGSTFIGSILALTSITVTTGTTVTGRMLARNGAVTLDTDTITRDTCAVAPSPTTTAPTTTAPPGPTGPTGPPATRPATTSPAPLPGGGVGGPGAGTGGPGGGGGVGGPGSGVIPSGYPDTGAGGTAGPARGALVVPGVLALGGAAVAMGLAVRAGPARRRERRR
jgi:hypothetical protein